MKGREVQSVELAFEGVEYRRRCKNIGVQTIPQPVDPGNKRMLPDSRALGMDCKLEHLYCTSSYSFGVY